MVTRATSAATMAASGPRRAMPAREIEALLRIMDAAPLTGSTGSTGSDRAGKPARAAAAPESKPAIIDGFTAARTPTHSLLAPFRGENRHDFTRSPPAVRRAGRHDARPAGARRPVQRDIRGTA